MKKFFFAAIAALALLAGCQENTLDVVVPEGLTPGDVRASIDASTKTFLGTNNVVQWVAKDSISVFDATTYNFKFELESGANTADGTFGYKGCDTGTGASVSGYYAVYPYDKSNAISSTDSSLTVTFPREFDAKNGFAKAVMVSKSKTQNTFVFQNAQGLIRLKLTAQENLPPLYNNVSKVQIISSAKTLSGEAKITFSEDNAFTVTLSKPAAADTITVDFGDPVQIDATPTEVIFPLVAAQYSENDLKIVFTFEDGQNSRKVEKDLPAINHQISKITTLSKTFTINDVNASTPDYGEVAPDVNAAAKQLETSPNVEIGSLKAGDELTIPAQQKNHDVEIKINAVEAGDQPIVISAPEDENAPTNVTIEAPAKAKVEVNCPNTHVTLNGTSYDEVTASTSETTLVVSEGVTVKNLIVKKGNVEVQGTVTTVTRNETNTENTKVTVKDGGKLTNTLACKIDSTYYFTLADAIAKVADNETIEVLKDITDANGISVPSGKNFTVDFGGHTYTCFDNPAGSSETTNQVFQLNAGNTITFKNGTINVAETNKTKFKFIIQNYCDLTLEDMTLDGTNLDKDDYRYTLSNNAGNITLTGNTSIKAAAERGVAFDIYYWKTYYPTAPVLTWKSTGSVDGKIELSGATFIVEKDLKVTTPIRATDNANGTATLTVKSGATISPKEKFKANVHTQFTGTSATFSEYAGGVVIVNRGADLKINGAGTITTTNNEEWCYAAVCLTEKGESESASTDADRAKLTVEGNVTLEGYYYGVVGNGSRHDTDITINGGTIKGIKANDCTGIYHPQKGNLTISGGTIEGATGIYVKSGDVEASISAGTIKGVGTNCKTYNPDRTGDGCDPTGDALVIDNCGYPGGAPTVEIKGGTFVSDHYKAVASYAKTGYPTVTGFINGGTFSDLSGVKYVDNNAVYTLGADVTNAAGMSLDTKKTFTVDFNNHTYTVNKPGAGSTNTQTSAFQLIAGQNITFKNGTIKAADANLNATADDGKSPIKRFIQNYANLTLTNMTLDGTNINGNNSVVEFCNGNVTIDGTTNFTAKSGVASINVDSWKGSYPNGTAVTINTTGNVGKIHCYTEGTGSMTTKSSLTIKNGKNITIDDVSNGEVTISVEGGDLGLPAGALKGVFTVADPDGTPNSGDEIKVHFSMGNLWADASGDKASNPVLHFEANQYDFDNSNAIEHESYFAWSSSPETAVSKEGELGNNIFCDVSHKVSVDGSDEVYYALSETEWNYLLEHNGYTCSAGFAQMGDGFVIESQRYFGLFLYPDNYEGDKVSDNSMTWEQINAADIVFLPAAGLYNKGAGKVASKDMIGYYWTSTNDDSMLSFTGSGDKASVGPVNSGTQSNGHAIRLVTRCN